MKARKNIFGVVIGYTITDGEMRLLRKIVRRMKGCQDKFDALAMFRNCGLLEPSECKDNGCE